MASYDKVAERWLAIALGTTTKTRQLVSERVIADGDRIYSYGRHFEIARVLRNGKGKPTTILLNGDTYSVSTTRHQSTVRSAIRGCGLPSVIIPFTALVAAGIHKDSVEPVDVSEDRTEVIPHNSATQPPGSVWRVFDKTDYVEKSPEALHAIVDAGHAEAVASWERQAKWAEEEALRGDPDGFWNRNLRQHPSPPLPGTVDDLSYYQRREYVVTGTETVLYTSGRSGVPITVETLDDGTMRYSWKTTRHWLGESLIMAKVTWSGFTACKSCKGTGRKGTEVSSRDYSNYASHTEYMAAVRANQCDTCEGRSGRHWTRGRRAFFLSGFDHQESRPLYFFCELPKGANPATVAEAYEALKPEPVVLAEQVGRPVVRQGDMFAIALPTVDKRSLRQQGARFEKRGTLLDTNHVATEVAYLSDGTTLARGVLYHAPGWRDPDHARRKLTEGWNVVVKNTVPVAA